MSILLSKIMTIFAWLCLLVLVGCNYSGIEQSKSKPKTDSVDAKWNSSFFTSGAVDWPQWQGPLRDGTLLGSPLKRVSKLEPVWELPVGLGYSSPIAWQETVVIVDRVGNEERVRAVTFQSGEVIWETRNPVTFENQFPMYTNGPIPTPAIVGNKLFTVGAEGLTQCLDLATGQVLWAMEPDVLGQSVTQDAAKESPQALPPFGTGASPVAYDQSVLVSLPSRPNTGSLFRMDQQTGSVLWQAVEQRSSYASPVIATIHGRQLVLMLHDAGLTGIDWDSGETLFQFPFRATVVDSENAVCPVVHGNQVFLSAYGMEGTLLEITEDLQCKKRWSNPRSIDSQYTNIILRNGVLMGFSARTKRLHTASWKTGESLGRCKLPMTRGMMVASENRLLVFGDNSKIAIVDISEPENLKIQFEADLSLKPKTFCSPCIVRNRLIVRDEEKMVAYEMINAH